MTLCHQPSRVIAAWIGLGGLALAQSDSFAEPVRLRAGNAVLGEGRLFPSPAVHDLNGDGLFDVFIGDLPGRVTFALQQKGDGVTFAEEQKLKDAEGKELDFGNW